MKRSTDERLRIGVVGMGRLGRAVVQACVEQGVPVVLKATKGLGWVEEAVPDVLVDASAPDAQLKVLEYCRRHRVALIECVSNLDEQQWGRLAELAEKLPIVRATNLTFGHYLQTKLVRHVAELPSHGYVVGQTGIWERHPTTKAHRPSASAVALAHHWAEVAGSEVAEICSQRAGLPVSEHEFQWTWAGETLSVRHVVGSLAASAAGALVAAHWLTGREAGLVSMHSVFDATS